MADLLINIDVNGGEKAVKSLNDISDAAKRASSSVDSFQREANKIKKPVSINAYVSELTKLQKELKSSAGRVSTLETEIDKLNKKLKNTSTNTRETSSSLGRLEGVFKTIKAAAIGYATVLATMEISNFVSDTLSAVIALDSLKRSFKAITGDVASSQQELEFVSNTANVLGLELTTLEKSYKDILAASKNTTLEGQGVRDVFLSISKAASVLGMTTDQTEGALRALSQMISKGNVQATVKTLALYTAMCIANPVNSGKTLTDNMRAILSQAWNDFSRRCNDYLFGEYTQVSGSAGHPIRVMI